MADDDKANKGENESEEGEDEEAETEDSEDEETEEEDGKDDKGKKDPELDKAIKRRDRALAENRRLKAQLAETKKDDDKGPSAEEKANARIVRSSARAILAAQGVTSKDDQASVLAVLNLSDIEVDDDGDPDEDTIEERIEDLKRIFGTPAKNSPGRTPRGTSSRGKASGGSSGDSDSARYRRFINGR